MYYPSGGWQDLEGAYDSPEDACVALKVAAESRGWTKAQEMYWWQIVDSATGLVLSTGESD